MREERILVDEADGVFRQRVSIAKLLRGYLACVSLVVSRLPTIRSIGSDPFEGRRLGRRSMSVVKTNNSWSHSKTRTTTKSLPSCTNSSCRRASSSCTRDFVLPRRWSASRRGNMDHCRPTCWRDRSSTSSKALRTPSPVPWTYLRPKKLYRSFRT